MRREMDNIKIRKAEPNDAEAWCRIRKECWLQVYPNEEYGITREDILLKDFDSSEQVKGWQDSFTSRKDCNYYTAENENKVVGMCLTYPDQDICEIGALYIDLSSQHQGIGALLMNKALADFDSSKKVNLKVVSYNDNAINFYKKFGFKIIGPVKDENGKLPNGKQLPEVEMGRE